jgi:hypothetical protein
MANGEDELREASEDPTGGTVGLDVIPIGT